MPLLTNATDKGYNTPPVMDYSLYRWLRTLSFACVLLGVCGCETLVDAFKEPEKVDSAVVATWWDGPRIRPGILLIVQVGVSADKPMTMEALVDQNGDITLPYLLPDPVACDGLTLESLKQKLVKAYSKYLRQPMITVTFAPFDGKGVSPWGTVTVLGEVMNPGPVNMPPTMDLTVTKVLQASGGCRPFADKSNIRVTRCDKDGRQTRTIVDISEIGKGGRIDKDMTLRAGDVVWVPETWY